MTAILIAIDIHNNNNSYPEVEILKMLARPKLPQGFVECLYWGHEAIFMCIYIYIYIHILYSMHIRTGRATCCVRIGLL